MLHSPVEESKCPVVLKGSIMILGFRLFINKWCTCWIPSTNGLLCNGLNVAFVRNDWSSNTLLNFYSKKRLFVGILIPQLIFLAERNTFPASRGWHYQVVDAGGFPIIILCSLHTLIISSFFMEVICSPSPFRQK